MTTAQTKEAIRRGRLAARDALDPAWRERASVAVAERLLASTRFTPDMIRVWRPGADLVKVGFGLLAPPPSAALVDPTDMLVPLAAFDRQGGRIGYGKGHYDLAIATHLQRSLKRTIGLAFAMQEVDSIPLEDHDRRLDLVVTESETIRARG